MPSQMIDIEAIIRKWLADAETPLDELNIFEAVRRGQSYTDGETLHRPFSLSEIVAMMMKVVDTNGRFFVAMVMSAIARSEGWEEDDERMQQEMQVAWATLDLLRIEVVDDILKQRGPLPSVDSNDPPSEKED